MRELGHIVDKIGFGSFQNVTLGTQSQLKGLQKAFGQYLPQLTTLSDLEQQVWKRRLRVLAHSREVTLAFRLQLEEWHTQALAHAENQELQDNAHQRKEYKQFLVDGSDGAAGLIHRLSKPVVPWQPVIGDRQGQFVSPEAAAENEAV